jgi:ribulose-phosphate 3-epimerase
MLQPIRLSINIGINPFQLPKEIQKAEIMRCDSIHVDVMDGHFVPNLSIGPDFIAALRSMTDLPIEVHLLIQQPDRFARDFIEAGADLLIVHLESHHDIQKTINLIRGLGCRCGLALNPLTLFEKSIKYLPQLQTILFLISNFPPKIHPFQPEKLSKIRKAKEYREKNNLNFEIQVEGGLSAQTIPSTVIAGANTLILESSFFTEELSVQTLSEILKGIDEATASG